MNTEVLAFVLGIAGMIIIMLFGVVGFFLRVLHTDVKSAVESCGKNKGRIELVEQQLNSDVKRIEQTTQLELRNLASTVNKLSVSVDQLVQFQLNMVRNDEDKR